MSIQADIFDGMADAHEAGAKIQRHYSMNHERQQQAESLEAMAAEYRRLAKRYRGEES